MRHEQTMNRRLDVETIDKQYNNVKRTRTWFVNVT